MKGMAVNYVWTGVTQSCCYQAGKSVGTFCVPSRGDVKKQKSREVWSIKHSVSYRRAIIMFKQYESNNLVWN